MKYSPTKKRTFQNVHLELCYSCDYFASSLLIVKTIKCNRDFVNSAGYYRDVHAQSFPEGKESWCNKPVCF